MRKQPRHSGFPKVHPAILVAVKAILLATTVAAQQRNADTPGMFLRMPGKSYRGELPELTAAETKLAESMRRDVVKLADEIGERHVGRYRALTASADWLEDRFAQSGYKVERQRYLVGDHECCNLIAEKAGGRLADEILVVGAHYDSAPGAPGANDNGSAVAGVLALAEAFSTKSPDRTMRFVAFVNEEPPYFHSNLMGSHVYAKRCRQREDKIVGMICLETIGYYRDDEDSQKYPAPFNLFYPSTGNFIAFVSNVKSAPLVKQVAGSFRRHTKFPSEGCAIPEMVTGVDWSDHWSFWQFGYPAIMVTDTAPFRYPYYHTAKDTPDRLDYDRMARVVAGVQRVLVELSSAENREP